MNRWKWVTRVPTNSTGTIVKSHALGKTIAIYQVPFMGRVALVVDDDPAVLELIAKMLEDLVAR